MRKHPYFLGICFPCCSVLMKIASQILLNILTKVIFVEDLSKETSKICPKLFSGYKFCVFLVSSLSTFRFEGNQLWAIKIKGSAFLWHQVRCMVAVLFMIGRGFESPDVRITCPLNCVAFPCMSHYYHANMCIIWDYIWCMPNIQYFYDLSRAKKLCIFLYIFLLSFSLLDFSHWTFWWISWSWVILCFVLFWLTMEDSLFISNLSYRKHYYNGHYSCKCINS